MKASTDQYVLTEIEIKNRFDQPVRWAIGDRGSIFPWVFGLLLLAWLLVFYSSKPDLTSPLISSLLNLLEDDSRWAITSLGNPGWSLWGGLLFIVGLLFFLYQLYFGLRQSEISEEQINSFAGGKEITRFVRTIHPVGLLPQKKEGESSRNMAPWVQLLFFACLLSNLVLYFFFYKLLEDQYYNLAHPSFYAVYGLAIATRLLCLFFGASKLLQYVFHDFGLRVTRFFRRYLSYFYPTIFLVAIVAFVLGKLDQFDAFFIELVQSPFNFVLFAIFLFPTSLILIWFAPSYLFFTDQNYAHREKSWEDMSRVIGKDTSTRSQWRVFGWLWLHKRLITPTDEPNDQEIPEDFLPFATEKIPPASESFFRVSVASGVFYISTLVGICVDIYYGNRMGGETLGAILPGLILLGGLAYWVFTNQTLHRALQKEIMVRRRVNRSSPPDNMISTFFYLLSDRSEKSTRRRVFYVREKWPFLLGLAIVGLAVVFFLGAFMMSLLGADWEETFGWFLLFLICSIFGFVWLAIYRRFYYWFSFDEPDREAEPSEREKNQLLPWDRWLDRLDHLSVQFMLTLNVLVAGLFIVFFFFGLVAGPRSSMAVIPRINPLNIYLIFSSGLVAVIMLTDRFLRIREYIGQYVRVVDPKKKDDGQDRIAVRHFFWGALIVFAGLLYSYYGNSYHEIDYQPISETEQRYDLDRYVNQFVDRLPADTTSPVIFIAADGGGLKACYWTMLNLYRLDTMGMFDNNVFMMSGASGGNMGLSMYTFLKARRRGTSHVLPAIKSIGSSNFLSGDLTGWLTRFPVNYLPNLPNWVPRDLEDRAEFMARAYFTIVGDAEGPYSFAAIRRQPYWWLWTEKGYRLPLFFTNTTRAEDGMRSIVHPLNEPILGEGRLDLTQIRDEAISFPDAAFLSNRFPIMSPAARIPGRGHFVDAGNSDNSGLSAIMHVLQVMETRKRDTSRADYEVYRQLFNRPIVVVSIRNEINRFVRDQFYEDRLRLTRSFYRSELGAHSNAGINSGISGVPRELDDYLRSETPRDLGLINEFYTLNLPFRLSPLKVQEGLFGELPDTQLKIKTDSINELIRATMGCPEGSRCFMVEPPLGRLMARPSLEYMEKMVEYPDNRRVFERLRPW